MVYWCIWLQGNKIIFTNIAPGWSQAIDHLVKNFQSLLEETRAPLLATFLLKTLIMTPHGLILMDLHNYMVVVEAYAFISHTLTFTRFKWDGGGQIILQNLYPSDTYYIFLLSKYVENCIFFVTHRSLLNGLINKLFVSHTLCHILDDSLRLRTHFDISSC